MCDISLILFLWNVCFIWKFVPCECLLTCVIRKKCMLRYSCVSVLAWVVITLTVITCHVRFYASMWTQESWVRWCSLSCD